MLDGARARDARQQLKSSARRTLARPAMLIAPLAAGALIALALSRPKRTVARASSNDPVRKTGLVALAATGLRLWSRSAMVRDLLKPVVRSVVNAPPQTIVAPRSTRGDAVARPDEVGAGPGR